MEYSSDEIEVLQALLDVFQNVPEAPLVGMLIRFNKPLLIAACIKLQEKDVAVARRYSGDPANSLSCGVNQRGGEEMVRLFEAGILKNNRPKPDTADTTPKG